MAMGFATDGADPDNDRHPVIYKVHFQGNCDYFDMDDPRFSAYPGEKEILINDGMKFKILSVEKTDLEIYLIQLKA